MAARLIWWVMVGGLLGVCPIRVFAGDDWQLWLEQKWRLKLRQQVSLFGGIELRFRNDMSDFFKHTDTVGLSIKPLSWLKIEPAYRYEWTEQATVDDTTIENRLYVNVTPMGSWGPFSVEDRHRIEFRHLNGRDDWRYRNKPKLSVGIGNGWYRFEPYVADEVFYGARAGAWNRNRVFLGIAKELEAHTEVELYYMIESNKQGRDWDEVHVLGIVFAAAF